MERFAIVSLLVLLGAASTMHAQEEPLQVPPDAVPFARRSWNSGTGLPQNTAAAIHETRDGYLWVATFGGLCRFDGERFEVFDSVTSPDLRTNRFNCLHEDAEGTLWIGSDGSGLSSRTAGDFRAWPEFPRAIVTTLASDAGGRLLIGTPQELWRREGESFVPVHAQRLRNVRRILARASGELLLAADGGLWRCDDARVELLAQVSVLSLAEIDARLLVGTDRGLFELDAHGLRPFPLLAEVETGVHAILRTRDDALWLGTNLGIVRVDPGEYESPSARAAHLRGRPPGTPARVLCEDRAGGLWVGHSGSGLTRLCTAELRAFRGESGLPPRGIVAVLDDGAGGAFVGTNEGLLHGRPGRFEPVPGARELGSCRGMVRTPDGTLWFATRTGLATLDEHGVRLVLGTEPFPSHTVRALLHEPGVGLWLASAKGLALLENGVLVQPPVAAPLLQESLRSLALAEDGALWIGGATLLARLAPDRASLRLWHAGRELPFGEVRAILAERGERAWIATYGGGLVLVEGERCVRVDERHGLQDQSLCSVLPFGTGLILCSNSGFGLLERAALEDVAAGRARNLPCRPLRTQGALPAEGEGGIQPCAAKVGEALLFCGIDALYAFEPARLDPLEPTLEPRLEHVFVGDEPWPTGPRLVLPRGARTLALRLACTSLDHPSETRFRWRLLGRSAEWSEALPERDVRLVDLPAGELVFEAESIDLAGRSSTRPLRLELYVPPLAWEQPLWRVAALASVVLLASLLVRLGARRAAHRAARLEALVEERTGALRSAQAELEQRVEERTLALRNALQRQAEEELERRRLEEQLAKLERMESIGLLAGGVAHDFNNLLMVAAGAGELLALGAKSERETALCSSLLEACERGRSLTHHLLALASRQMVTTERLGLGEVVRELRPMLHSLLGDDIELRLETGTDPLPVRAAKTQIEQILMNLAANARDALPRGGRMTIRLAGRARHVELEVEDTGEGMPPEVARRVFEPFYSTRKGPGRGLGLATVYGVTKQLGGEITLDSEPGRGTRIRIVLPRSEEPAEPVVEVPRPVPPARERTILLIEDETAVRRVLELLLASLGCRVLAARDGEHALELLRTHTTSIDAVVSDVVMPGLQGLALVVALRAVRPDLPIVFVSGYPADRLTHRDLLDHGLEILAKPIDRSLLAEVLERLAPAGTALQRASDGARHETSRR